MRVADGSFDAVLSSFGVMFFDDAAAAFANLRRALRRGGRLAFLCWRAREENPDHHPALRQRQLILLSWGTEARCGALCGSQAATWYSWVSPPRTCSRRIRTSAKLTGSGG